MGDMNGLLAGYLRRVVKSAQGDSLERAESAFRGYSDKEMNGEYGQSGETCRAILEGYRTNRHMNEAAGKFLDSMLKEKGL